MTVEVLHGDCLEVLPTLDADSFDSCVTDPPYHLTSIVKRFGGEKAAPAQHGTDGAFARASRGFMGKQWDGGDVAFRPETWAEVFRVLKPGAHLIAFSGTRTYHRMVCAIEDAGFEIRDQIGWLYGSGFPKSQNVSKAMDKAAGAVREVISEGRPVKRMIPGADQNSDGSWIKDNGRVYVPAETAPASAEAIQWNGWGTALKPAWEPIVLARKPLVGTVAANVLQHGTGALNIEASRVGFAGAEDERESKIKNRHADFGSGPRENRVFGSDDRDRGAHGNYDPPGRWPANVIHDGSPEVLAAFAASGETATGHFPKARGAGGIGNDGHIGQSGLVEVKGDSGTAARFFYSAKADAGDRLGSKHPTVKPVDPMRYLLALVTPPGGRVLDPFAGSGTTGGAAMLAGFDAVLIEREAEYIADIRRRLGYASGDDSPLFSVLA